MTEEIALSNFVLEGRWRFQTQLGYGADGTVYLAIDETTGRKVAIKVYDSLVGHELEQVREKIAGEAEISAGIDSPFLVSVIRFGIAPGQGGVDAGYMVMEYLEGETLRDMMERRVAPMPPNEAVDLTRLILFAVNSLHRQGYVHQDLKPENIFILQPHTDEAKRIPVKIFDFGAARPVSKAHLGPPRGTPIYAAPEVAQRAPKIGFQSDVYSIGVTLFEMIAGTPPVVANATPAQIVAQHSFGELASMPELLDGLPIAEIYRKATARDPEQRYRDAGAMLTALSALRPVRTARLPAQSPFSSVTVEDSVQGSVPRLDIGDGPVGPKLPRES